MDIYTLKLRQAMSLEDKIRFTQRRVEEWVEFNLRLKAGKTVV